MCGRYAASRRPEELMEEFEIEAGPSRALEPNWNTAPTQPIYVIAEDDQKRTLLIARWGLIPSWAKDAKIGARTINARAESVADKPSFRSAFKSRRCLVPADGYYEWYTLSEQGAGHFSPKQPFFIHRKDGKSVAMAGLYEHWRDPGSGDLITSATIITANSVGRLAQIHDRMPVVLPQDRYEAWLAPEAPSKEALLALLDVKDADRDLIADPVSRLVNSIRNNGAELVKPLPFEDESLRL